MNTERCLPSVVTCDAKGRCKITDCDCAPREGCHVALTGPRDAARPVCEGTCPPGAECEMQRQANDDGTTSVWCECVQQACEPTTDGLSCQDHACPTAGEVCVPQLVQCDASGKCRVVKCECQPREECRLTLPRNGRLKNNDFRFCRGDCPDGSRCEETRTPIATGGFVVSCECVPEVCEPAPDGRRCREFDCPNPNERCTPQAVECDSAGNCKVIACDCDRPNRCHPQITNGHQDPPVVCVGACPDGTQCERVETLTPTGGVIVKCDCKPIPQECEPNPNGFGCKPVTCPNPNEKCVPQEVVCVPGAPCRVTQCDCQPSDQCHVEMTSAAGPICVGDCPDGFDCERRQTPVAGGGIAIRCECVPVPPPCEPRETGFGCKPAVCPASNEKCIPIAVAVAPDGTIKVLACDCRGPDECHVVPSPLDIFPPQFDCAGSCPPGMECHERTVTTDNGTVITRCDCVPVQPECEPNSAGTDCRPIVCPDPNEKCRPTKVLCGPNNVCRVIDCDCVGDTCHVEMTAAAGPFCVGSCPDGQTCVREFTPTDLGTLIECRCEPIEPPCHAEVDPATNTIVCKGVCPPGQECRRIEVGGTVTCECRPVEPPCHREVDAAGNVTCAGVCPPGLNCNRVSITMPDGTIFIDCRCEPLQQPCHRETGVNGEVICVGTCPPGEACKLTPIVNPDGTVTTDCFCVDIPQPCHAEVDPITNTVVCKGVCPPGQECRRFELNGAVTCDCVPVPQPCHRELDANGDIVCVGFCPDGTTCTRVEVTLDDGTIVIDCRCEPIEPPCHAEVDPTNNAVICKGTCPPGTTCTRVVVGATITCDCLPVQQPCHREVDSAGNLVCVGTCPPGEACKLTPIVNPDGTVTTDCFCQPIPQPCHAEVDPITNTVVCKGVCPPGQECRRFELNGAVTCDCVPVPQPCHRELDAAGNIVCVGFCPDGTTCTRVEVTLDDGTIVIDCRCEPIQPPCHAEVDPATGVIKCVGVCPPGTECRRFEANGAVTCDCAPVTPVCQPDPTTSTGCSNTICPTGETCIPVAVSVTSAGVVTVIACDCRGSNECHIVPSPLDIFPPQFDCEGSCPPGFMCQEVNLSTTTGDVITRCDCLPLPGCDPDPTSPTGCSLALCPVENQRCLPTRVNCFDGVCRIVECECQPFDRCHVTIDAAAGPTCTGGCPTGSTCIKFESSTDKGELIVECGCAEAP